MLTFILQATHAGNLKDGLYLGLAIGAAVLLFLVSRKFRRKG